MLIHAQEIKTEDLKAAVKTFSAHSDMLIGNGMAKQRN
jgi:hypothetical protein